MACWQAAQVLHRRACVVPTFRPPRSFTLNAWLKLDTDGRVTVTMSKSEMGQGVHTALLMLVA